ncbi:methyl-accepting chemotaxis protein [Lutibaculum baratangense]|uniref:Methyl-accepting chemotaxis protein McpD n=1 Tax=Lutibaculum baratangense AMV1 TaxID=631454 RepID=V4QU29_9HYPH|nr:methyl-accepting chemotaxis protein [Lutibaculum baratangense]ESR23282.1 methyl-accepting chemotaxis protein McpD [Lutibaculum baratangense AMV1]
MKISIMMVAALTMLGLAAQATAYYTMRGEAAERATRTQAANMAVAWDVLRGYGRDFRVANGTFYAGSTALNGFYEPVDRVKELVGGTATIFMGDTRVSTNVKKPDGSRAVGTQLAPGAVHDALFVRGEPYRGEADILGTSFFTAYDPIKNAAGETVGVLYVGIPQDEFFAPVDALAWKMAGISATVLLLMAAAALWLARRMFAPLQGLARAIDRVADGDTQVSIPGLERSDDVGHMAAAVSRLKQAAVEKLRVEAEAAERRREAESERAASEESRRAASEEQEIVVGEIGRGLSRLSDGDLGYRIARAFPANYEQLKADFNGAMAQLEEAMRTIAASTTAIRSGTGEISQASDDLSRRTEQQAASLEETAAALDEITATVKRTADGAGHARDVVGRTTSLAEQSGAVVGDAVKAMSGIEASSKEISQIIGVIDEIAFQTNLLALNAGVEAARAGDAGKGFAVVASEVRALAQRSAEAAKEIKGLIDNSTAQVDQGVDLVARTGEALKEIAAQVAEINAIVRDISASAQEQATGLAEVNTAVNQMDQVTQQNAAMVEQQTAASHTLSNETGELVRLVSRFRLTGEAQRAHGAEPAEARRPAPARPARRPATHGNAALRMEPANEDQGWEEF